MRAIKAGDKVRGEYLGNPFVGTVHTVRWHTMDYDTREVAIDFDGPTEVRIGKGPAMMRERCLCYVGQDGGEALGHTRGGGSTWVEVVA
jgi:hypothetical protein